MPTLIDEAGLRLGMAEAVLVAVVAAAGLLALPVDTAVVPAALLVLFAGRWLTAAGALCLSLSAWALLTGFVENSLGQLTLAVPDLERLAVLLVAGAAAWLAGQGPHWTRAR